MTDFFVLPGGTVDLPGRGPIGGTPTVTPQNSAPEGGVVQFTSAEWQQRAKVARECAEDLERARLVISNAPYSNHFGEVREGEEFYSRLLSVTGTWRTALTQQIGALLELASQCDNADDELHRTDRSSAKDLRA